MPGYKGHVVGALAMYIPVSLVCAAMYWSPKFLLVAFVSMMLGSLFPDVDTGSKGRKLLLILLMVASASWMFFGKFFESSLSALSGLLLVVGARHRYSFHNIYLLALFSISWALIAASLMPVYSSVLFTAGLFFFFGCWSHVVLDMGIRRSLKWR